MAGESRRTGEEQLGSGMLYSQVENPRIVVDIGRYRGFWRFIRDYNGRLLSFLDTLLGQS